MRFARRRYLTGSVASLGSVLAAACSLTESRRPGTGPPLRRVPPATLRVLYGPPWFGDVYTEIPVVYVGPDGRPETPGAEWFRTTVAPAFMERYPDSTVSFESHHDPLNRALELHRAGTAPDIFQTDDLRNTDLIRRRLAHRLDGWIKQWRQTDDFVRPAWLAGQTAGVQWGLPLLSQVYTLYFNRHVLRAAGFGQSPKTWGELLDTAYRSTLVRVASWFRRGCPRRIAAGSGGCCNSRGSRSTTVGGVAALEHEAEVVLDWLRDLDAAVRPSGVAPLERSKYFPSVEDSASWHLGKVAHAWVPFFLPPQSTEVEQRRAALSGPPSAAAGQPTPESTLIGVPPVPGSTRYALPGGRSVPPLVHAHTAVLHVSTQSAAPDDAWELLTMLLEPETLYSYTHLRWAVPPRKSILGRGYLQSANTQEMVALWLRYGRPPFDPPRYAAVSQAIEATFQAVVVSKQQSPGEGVRKLVAQLEKIARDITPPYTGTTRR